MAIWTDPKVYADTNNVNSEVLNKYLSENMRYLFRRPRNLVTLRDVGSFTITSTTLVPVSEPTLRLTTTLQKQADVKLSWSFLGAHNTASVRTLTIDFLQDSDIYLSSLDTTPLSGGLQSRAVAVSSGHIFSGEWIIPNLSAGTHYWDLYAAQSANTLTIYTNPALQLSVREI